MPPPALLHRYVDPLLGVFTGFLAYYLHETHPRTAPPPGERLTELIRWKMDKNERERREKLQGLETAEQWPPAELNK